MDVLNSDEYTEVQTKMKTICPSSILGFSSHGPACSIYQTGSKAFTSLGHCLCGVGVVCVVSMDQVDLYVCDGEIISIT